MNINRKVGDKIRIVCDELNRGAWGFSSDGEDGESFGWTHGFGLIQGSTHFVRASFGREYVVRITKGGTRHAVTGDHSAEGEVAKIIE